MAIKVFEFGAAKEMEFFLQGGITGGKIIVTGAGRLYGLHGLTLIFTAPAGTVTFSDAGSGLTYQDIALQIRTELTSLLAFYRNGQLHLVEAAPTTGVKLSKDGTANTVFGFSNGKAHEGIAFNPPDGGAPRFLETRSKAPSDGYYATVELA